MSSNLETAVKIWGESPHAGSNDTSNTTEITTEITNLRQEMEQMAKDGMTDAEMLEFYTEVTEDAGLNYNLSDLSAEDTTVLRDRFPLTSAFLERK